MNAKHYLTKAEMLLSRKMNEKVVESLEKAISTAKEENDFITLFQSNCFMGEFLFMQGEYEKASEYLDFVQENAEKAIASYDDLLNDEINESNLLISLIGRYAE